MLAEGWYLDPFGVHEARWYSDGTPTSLVRDGNTESSDVAPSDATPGELVPWRARDCASDATDARRADDAASGTQPFSPRDGVDAALSRFKFIPS
jgi:hypothetical protein